MFMPRIQRLPAIAVLASTVLGSGTAHATDPGPAKPKQSYALRIGIDDGRTSVRTGDRLTYVTRVSNTGTTKTPGLRLSQTLVPGVKLISSAPKGTVSQGRITWDRALSTGGTSEFRVTVEVGRLAGHPERLAAVACASTRTDNHPLVCASHLDLLGDAAGAASARPAGSALTWGVRSALAGAAALVLTMLALLVRRRRRHADRIPD